MNAQKNIKEEKIDFSISAKGLQNLLSHMQIANDLYDLKMDRETKYIYDQLSDIFRETNYGKYHFEQMEKMHLAYKESKKVVSIDFLRGMRDSEEFCKKYDHLI